MTDLPSRIMELWRNADELTSAGRHADAEILLKRALEQAERAEVPVPGAVVGCLDKLAKFDREQGDIGLRFRCLSEPWGCCEGNLEPQTRWLQGRWPISPNATT